MRTFVKPINVKIVMKMQIIELNCALIMLFITSNSRTLGSMTINQGIHKMLFCNQNLTLEYQACFTSKCYLYSMWVDAWQGGPI